jgi:PAS domain S-box-containing protein
MNTLIKDRLEATPAAVIVTTSDEKVIYWNGRGEAIFGYDSGDAVGRLLTEIIVPASGLEEEQEFLRKTLETGSGILECVRQTKDGSLVFVYISSKVLRNAEGEIEFVLSSIKDMTGVALLSDAMIVEPTFRDNEQSENLRQSEERFQQFVEGAEDYASLMLDPEGRVVSWNVGAERVNGYKAKEIIGRHFSCFYPSERIALGHPEWDLRTAREQGHSEDEGWRLREDGERFWANILITVLFRNDGLLKGFALVMRDLTKHQEAEVLRYKNIELQNAAEAKDRFLANMSHELRTPLHGIIGFAEVLADGKPGGVNPEQKEYLEDIANCGKHLLQLINDVLDLAKVRAGKMELNPATFPLAKAIAEICAVAKHIAQNKTIQIAANVASEIGDVMLDQTKFRQVLYNLLSNAIKFTEDGGKVEIFATRDETSRLRLVVKDTGIGIKAENLGRLFKEFEQLDSGVACRHEGTGLGLALTKRIVAMQGGTIDVESEVGKGSSFTVVLPMVNS